METAPLKGVNLGGWLIVERWMTPSVFKGSRAVDEYTLSQTEKGRSAIKQHRDTFIDESDFIWLRDNGVNAIRLPVGYWMFDGDDLLMPHVEYVDWVMKMANKYGLKVIIDLHGLEGSQNGNDHSGRVGASDWFRHKGNRTKSLVTLLAIALRYKDDEQLWGLQIINEPKVGLFHFKLRHYYRLASQLLEAVLEPHTHIIFSDGFTPRLMTKALGRSERVVMDVHLYHGAKPSTKYMSLARYYRSLRGQARLLGRLSKDQPVIVGEWSGSFRQSVFDQFPVSKHGELVKEHCARQIESFKDTEGWFYWNYKTEKPGVWHFRSQVEAGIIVL